jgi:hypothetical protein
MLPILFTLPADFASTSLAYVGSLVTDLSVPIYIIIGISLGMWIINYVVGLFSRRARARR